MRLEHQPLVLKWRTQTEVTQYMFTDVPDDLDAQVQWFTHVTAQPEHRYWMISLKNQFIGVASLNDIQSRHKRCSWGYYIGDPSFRLVGGLIAPYIYRYVFDVLGLNKITGEVMEGNENVRKMHLTQGCREVGTLRQHVYKYDRYHDVYMFELLRSDWEEVGKKFQHCIAQFEE